MKKYIFVGIMLFFIIILTGCDTLGLSEENKEKAKKYEAQGKEMAVNYIKEKYGFDAKVLSSKAETNRVSLGPLFLTGNVYVEMSHNKKKFYVRVPVAGDDYDEIADSYQNDEIKKALLEKLEDIFNSKIVEFKSPVEYNTVGRYGGGIVYNSKYFDGSNLELFVTEFDASIINAKELDSYNHQQLETLLGDNHVKIYNYKSKKAFEQYPAIKNNMISISSNAIHMKGYYVYQGFEKKLFYYKVDINENDLILVIEDHATKKIYSIDNYEKTKISDSDMEKIYEMEYQKPKKILYSFSLGDSPLTYVYLNENAYKKYKQLGTIYYCKSRGFTNSDRFVSIGDYYVSNVNMFNCTDGYLLIGTYESK